MTLKIIIIIIIYKNHITINCYDGIVHGIHGKTRVFECV